MPMTKQATQFVAPSGRSFVYLSDFPCDREVLYSPDGITFYELARRGFGGTAIEHNLSFDDPHQGVSGKLRRNGNVIDYNGERYTQQDVSFDQSSVVPLPATRCTEYLCQSEDDTFLYVSADKYDSFYESFRLFIGNGTTMREVPVQHVRRYRDGGTTYIHTPEETFFSPSPSKAQRDADLVPQWGSQKLTNLNEDDFDIVETLEGEVSITKR